LQAMLQEVGDLPFLSVDLGDLIESEGMIEDIEEFVDPSDESVWQRLRQMTGPQRLREAMRGGREERNILIRDRNRIIAAAVLRNPRMTQLEVESFAAMRSAHEDLL